MSRSSSPPGTGPPGLPRPWTRCCPRRGWRWNASWWTIVLPTIPPRCLPVTASRCGVSACRSTAGRPQPATLASGRPGPNGSPFSTRTTVSCPASWPDSLTPWPASRNSASVIARRSGTAAASCSTSGPSTANVTVTSLTIAWPYAPSVPLRCCCTGRFSIPLVFLPKIFRAARTMTSGCG